MPRVASGTTTGWMMAEIARATHRTITAPVLVAFIGTPSVLTDARGSSGHRWPRRAFLVPQRGRQRHCQSLVHPRTRSCQRAACETLSATCFRPAQGVLALQREPTASGTLWLGTGG